MLEKSKKRLKRKNRIRSKVSGTATRPRLSVYRSNTNIFVQLIDDEKWVTLAAASDLKMKREWTKTEMAKKVWEDIAKKISDLKLSSIVFDRNGFLYHGRVKALADAIRDASINF